MPRASALAAAAGAALALALPAAAQDGGLVARGADLFRTGCSSCHGLDARGIPGVAPNLHGVGARAADFYLTTGRMPLQVKTGSEPLRAGPAYPPEQIRALVAYVGSLGGPPVPTPHPERGNVSAGQKAFTAYCAGCHQVMGQGGVVTGAVAPPLTKATATQIAEAVRVGPYLMPAFGPNTIDDATLDSIVLYVQRVVQSPPNEGGWGIGNIGPVPEGLVAWLIAMVALVVVARLLGERTE